MCTSEAQCTPRHIPNITCKCSKRKIDFSTIPMSPATSPILNTRRIKNTSILPVLNPENTSPILNSRKKEPYSSQTSPVLRTRRKSSLSPIVNSKQKLESNKKSNCVRKLQYETTIQEINEETKAEANKDILLNIQSVEEFDSCNKKFTLNFKSEHIKQPIENNSTLKTNNVFNDNFNYKKRKRKRNTKNFHKKIKTNNDDIKIETICSQEIANQIENSIIEKLESPRNILKNVSFNKSNSRKFKLIEEKIQDTIQIELVPSQKNEEIKIEIVNSQEIQKPSEIFATKFQPHDGIIEETSQNSYTPKSTIIESQIIVIDESQSSFAPSNISNCTVVQDSFEKSSDEYIWSPVKKKKYKPGTYSHKFQRILRKQKANTAIWKHEQYLANSTNYEIPVSEEDLKITIVEVCKINSDYGMNIFECVEVESKEKCLIVADASQLLDDLVLREKDLIKIFPPFFIDYLTIDRCNIKMFVNVHKILKCT